MINITIAEKFTNFMSQTIYPQANGHTALTDEREAKW